MRKRFAVAFRFDDRRLADTAESTASENSTASDTSTSETDTTTNTVVAKSSEMGFPCDKLTDPNSASIYMVSLDTDTVVYTYNPDERRPMASMTKIMTYIVTAETVIDLQNTRTTVPESVAEELEARARLWRKFKRAKALPSMSF